VLLQFLAVSLLKFIPVPSVDLSVESVVISSNVQLVIELAKLLSLFLVELEGI
jgi:hypothetical protein